MTDPLRPAPRLQRLPPALLALLLCAPVLAETAARPDARQRYQRESATCSAIRAHDARANCLSEASTRYASTRPSAPGESPEVLARNATQRCAALPEDQRANCVARMQGQGTTSGTVSAGGIYRELVSPDVPRATPARP